MSTMDGYMSRCDCGNLYLPTSRGVCEPCYGVAQQAKFMRRRLDTIARRQAKLERKAAIRAARKKEDNLSRAVFV